MQTPVADNREPAAEARSLTLIAFDRVRADVIGGRLRPGERLRVQALSARYGIGATAIREALSRLVTDGLVLSEEQRGNYSASKAAVIGLTKTWARELGPKGIRVNAVVPGSIATPMLQAVPAQVLAQIEQASWLKRVGRPDEVAQAYAFLVSDDASYVNGAALEVSGGFSA